MQAFNLNSNNNVTVDEMENDLIGKILQNAKNIGMTKTVHNKCGTSKIWYDRECVNLKNLLN